MRFEFSPQATDVDIDRPFRQGHILSQRADQLDTEKILPGCPNIASSNQNSNGVNRNKRSPTQA